MPVASGPPSIQRVRLTDPSTTDSSLSQATLGSTLAIVGKNLVGATTVAFNGYVVDVNPVYATDQYLVITVPDSVPTVATNPNVPDELKVTTPKGEAIYKFKILPPPPAIERISNEYAKAGESVTLYGKYFFFVDTVSFPGSAPITTGFSTSADGTSLTVTMPSGVDASAGGIFVKSQSGWSADSRENKLYDHSGTGMMLDWDTKNDWGGILNFGWGLDPGKVVMNTFPGIKTIDNNFAMINMNIPANWGWTNDKVIDMDNWSGTNGGLLFPQTPADKYNGETPLASYDLKFELSTLQPIGELLLQLSRADFSINVPLKDFVKSSDGQWYTVSVNLGKLVDGGGNAMNKYKDLNTNQTMRIVISNGTTADIRATMAIDNIRVIRVMN